MKSAYEIICIWYVALRHREETFELGKREAEGT